MPEGPELLINSRFVNNMCKGRVFSGKVIKSEVSKCCEVDYSSPRYTITSEARGKEAALILQCLDNARNRIRLLFRFGMSGRFKFSPAADIPKHAHLLFFTNEQPQNVLSFVDVRRFGSWRVADGWGEDRGPDPMYEHKEFRRNMLENLEDLAFNRPICEAMLNQKYFNGVGNYLRAEILFRAGIAPFTCARKVLEPLKESGGSSTQPDFLQLCHDVPLEVVELKVGLGKASESPVANEDYRNFIKWLRCYENPAMRNLKDHNGRTMWFKGEAGPMAPKIQKSRVAKPRKSVDMVVKEEEATPPVPEGQANNEDIKQPLQKKKSRKTAVDKHDEVQNDSYTGDELERLRTRLSLSHFLSHAQPPPKRPKTEQSTPSSVAPRRSTRIKAAQVYAGTAVNEQKLTKRKRK